MPGLRSLFGLIEDVADPRDRPFHLSSVAPETPPSIDLSARLPEAWHQGDLGSCHDDQTEVLTDRGWMLFANLAGGERLATVDPETAKLYFERPKRLIRMPYDGQLICANNASLNFRVTPDHMMLVRPWDEAKRTLSSKYKLVAAKDIGWYCGLLNRVDWRGENSSDVYVLPGVEHKLKAQREPLNIPMNAWLRFLGIYLAEGTMLKRSEQGADRVSFKIQIAASKAREKDFVRELLGQIGVNALELNDRFTFSNKRIFLAMSALGLEGVKAAQKRVPEFVFWQSAANIRQFLLGHFMGDGCVDRGGVRAHYTSSRRLADDLQRLIFLSGQETRISSRAARSAMMADGRSVVGRHAENRVSVCERKNLSIERIHNIFSEDYVGEVFCAEVPTFHTLVTRRNGKILVSGNCTAHACAGLLAYLHPGHIPSRLALYYETRELEGTTGIDAGSQIRDAMKVMLKQGVVSEELWPYDESKFDQEPTNDGADPDHTIANYSRINTLQDMLDCLSMQFPFVLSIDLPANFNEQAGSAGVMALPSGPVETIGLHAMLAVGFDRDFRNNPDFAASGLEPSSVEETMFLVRNSWGSWWGRSGNFWLPASYLTNRSTVGDCWTGFPLFTSADSPQGPTVAGVPVDGTFKDKA